MELGWKFIYLTVQTLQWLQWSLINSSLHLVGKKLRVSNDAGCVLLGQFFFLGGTYPLVQIGQRHLVPLSPNNQKFPQQLHRPLYNCCRLSPLYSRSHQPGLLFPSELHTTWVVLGCSHNWHSWGALLEMPLIMRAAHMEV